jgi:sugar phosphate isomerase/epimerase
MNANPRSPEPKLNRRQFIAAGAGMAATLAGAAEARWKMRLSTSSVMFVKLSVGQFCERAAKLGFEAVDIWGPLFKCTHMDDIAASMGGGGLKELLTKHKLKLCAFSVYRGDYQKYVEMLGVAGGGVAIRGSERPCKPEELTAKMKDFLERLKPFADFAGKNNSYLAIENHGHALLDSIDSLKAFTDLNKHPHLGIALAPYHIQAGKMSVEDAIAACGKQLLFFYAWQHGKGIEQLPGHGPTDFTPWLAALAKIGYTRDVNPFMHGELEPEEMTAAVAKSRQYMLDCYAKAVRG